MITSFEYSQGYSDALFDVYDWFNCSLCQCLLKGIGIKQDSVAKLLKTFIDYKGRFMREKEDFEIVVKHDKKKIIEIKPNNSELREKIDQARAEKMLEEDREYYFKQTGIRL